MAITTFQRDVLRLLAKARLTRGESYVAGGVALNLLLEGRRFPRDINLFHDTEEALAASWSEDRETLSASGFTVSPVREAPSFVEARVARGGEATLMQWGRDSAFRFFPLVTDELTGRRRRARNWLNDELAANENSQRFPLLVNSRNSRLKLPYISFDSCRFVRATA